MIVPAKKRLFQQALIILDKVTIGLPFVIIWLANVILISCFTKEIKLRRGKKISLKKDKKIFRVYQIIFIMGLIVLILFEVKFLIN